MSMSVTNLEPGNGFLENIPRHKTMSPLTTDLLLFCIFCSQDTGFVFFSTFFCVLFRFVSVFSLTYIANRYIQRVRMINFEEQLLMAYGGLRGAIAFSLALMLEENHVKHARIFTTTSLFIVLFTVFILGSTTKPVVRWLEVQLHVHHDTSMFIEINNKVVETVMSGIEEVAGHRSVNYWNQKMERFNEKYLKSILTSGEGHSFKDTFALLYEGFVPDSPTSVPLMSDDLARIEEREESEIEEDTNSMIVMKPLTGDATPDGDNATTSNVESGTETPSRTNSLRKSKKISFKALPIGLIRSGSKRLTRPVRVSTEEDLREFERKFIASAFSKSKYYHMPDKDDIDDRDDRVALSKSPMPKSPLASEETRSKDGKWLSVRFKMLPSSSGEEASSSTDDVNTLQLHRRNLSKRRPTPFLVRPMLTRSTSEQSPMDSPREGSRDTLDEDEKKDADDDEDEQTLEEAESRRSEDDESGPEGDEEDGHEEEKQDQITDLK